MTENIQANFIKMTKKISIMLNLRAKIVLAAMKMTKINFEKTKKLCQNFVVWQFAYRHNISTDCLVKWPFLITSS